MTKDSHITRETPRVGELSAKNWDKDQIHFLVIPQPVNVYVEEKPRQEDF